MSYRYRNPLKSRRVLRASESLPAPSGQPLGKALVSFEAALAASFPSEYSGLRPPRTEADLVKIFHEGGFRVDQDILSLFLWRDGSAVDSEPTHEGRMLSAFEALGRAEQLIADARSSGADDDYLQPLLLQKSWLPLFENGIGTVFWAPEMPNVVFSLASTLDEIRLYSSLATLIDAAKAYVESGVKARYDSFEEYDVPPEDELAELLDKYSVRCSV